jgi:sarcosine oxidase subunit gamma
MADRLGDLARLGDATGGAVVLRTIPFLAQVDLRIDAGASDGATPKPWTLPREPNTAWEEGARAALWLGPDEWLLVDAAFTGAAIVAELETAFGARPHSAVDVSANRVVLELSGAGTKEVLSKGCSLDLDPRGGWIPGRCAQTLLARVPVILHERVDASRVLVRPSFADYLVDWLIDAGPSRRGGR